MDIEYADNDIDRFDGWIVHVNESNFADLSEDETVGVLPSYPIAMVLMWISCQSIGLFDDTSLIMELETMDIVDMVADINVRCCSMWFNIGLRR